MANMTNVEFIRTGVENWWKQVKETRKDLFRLEAWNSLDDIKTSSAKLRELVERTVILADLVVKKAPGAVGEITGADKREAVISSITDRINAAVNIPFLPESVEARLIRIPVGMAVDMVCDRLNDIVGHDWKLDKVEQAIRSGKDFLDIPEYPWARAQDRKA
jgi:hypothetical protein